MGKPEKFIPITAVQSFDLFDQAEAPLTVPVEQQIEEAKLAVKRLIKAGHPIVVAFSGGKDSSLVAAITFHAAAECAAEGNDPFVVVTSASTGVENPEIDLLIRQDHARMRSFAKQYKFRLATKIVEPNLTSTWQVKILSGRGIPSFPGGQSSCTVDWKIQPQRVFRNQLFKGLRKQGLAEPITVLGSRLDESAKRERSLKVRGDSATEPVLNKDGELILAPIMHFSTDDVWEGLYLYSGGVYPSYSDYSETFRVYAGGASTGCVVVADAIYAGQSSKGKCGARLGCWTCQMAEDKSLANMLQFDERYAYARGLHRLNQFIRATRYDWTRRSWVGRVIKGGWISIQPDVYSPAMIRELTRYVLQLDFDEEQRAIREGDRRRFHILPTTTMVAIDALQSLYGVADRPFTLWADYLLIRSGRVRYDIPDVPQTPATPLPEARFLYVGTEYDDYTPGCGYTGLRDSLYEAMTADAACAPEMKEVKGRLIWDVPTGSTFSVDPESVAMLEDFEIDRLLERYVDDQAISGVTEAYKFYLRYGAIQLSHSQQNEHDATLRRTEHRAKLGLTGRISHEELLARTVSFHEMDEAGCKAWANKATINTAQCDLF